MKSILKLEIRTIQFLPLIMALFAASTLDAQQKNMKENNLKFTNWTKGLNVPDPVAISFDEAGNAYVTQTTRRKANDLDIRNNRDWTVNDVSFQSVADKLNFYRERLAPSQSDKNKRRVKDLNRDGRHDFHDLKVLSEKIHRISDTDGDGIADKLTVFAEGFQTEVTGIAAGVLHFRHPDHSESVYATIAPDVWQLTDTTGDGRADRRKKVASGFGLHIAYAGHDMHGLTVGPDGKIYWSIGDKGISVTTADGKKFLYPNQGGVLRCNPDGSDFEVFAHGLRNVQELAFDQYGNLFGVDNDADQAGERERFVYIVKDMDAGWRCHYQYRGSDYSPWTREKLWQTYHPQQPAYIVPPIQYSLNGPCGFDFNPGTALSPRYLNYFFLTGAPHGEQVAFKVESHGASFKMIDEHHIGKGIALIGINFGPDGALYGVDWANGYPLNQKGAIWKIDSAQDAESEIRKSTWRLLKQDFRKMSLDQLVSHLQHPDQRVRLRSQFELVRREDHVTLANVAFEQNMDQLARIHAIWGVGQLQRAAYHKMDWSRLLKDNDPEIQTQTLRIIADLKSFDTGYLLDLVDTDSPRVRFHLLLALAKHGTAEWLPTVIDLASRQKPEEVYLRHAIAQAMARCQVDQHLELIVNHQNQLVKLCAVVALRVLKSPAVAQLLEDESSWVRAEAARAIHDDFSIPQALPKLAQQLNGARKEQEGFLRRAMNANYRLGTSDGLRLLLEFASSEQDSKLRTLAIDWVAEWESPVPLDKVTGRFRGLKRRQLSSQDRERIKSKLVVLLGGQSGEVATATVRTLRKLGISLEPKALYQIVSNPVSPESLAIESLKNLVNQKSNLADEAIKFALKSKKMGLRITAIQQLDVSLRLKEIKSAFPMAGSFDRQELVKLAAAVGDPDSVEFLNAKFRELLEEKKWEPIGLELFEALQRLAQKHATAQKWLKEFEQEISARNLGKPEYLLCLEGGDARRGKRLFETHLDAQCTRCHRVGRNGSSVGPKLDGIAKKRDQQHLLRAILEPSADIEPDFQTIKMGLFSGQLLSGVKVREDKTSITIADATGKEIKVAKDDIEQMGVNKKSIMPELEQSLKRNDIRDLVAYLKSLK